MRTSGKSFLVLSLLAAASCVSTTQQETGLLQVDDVVVRIEHVHVECELAKERVGHALANLMTIVSPDFEGDAVAAHRAFLVVVEQTEKHAKDLRAEVARMKQSAEPFFEQWEADLRTFAGAEMRQRSRDRMLATKTRYEAIVSATRPMLADYDQFNLGLRDVAIFLGHDFNATSDLGPEIQALNEHGAELIDRLGHSLQATREYVEVAGLPMRVDVSSSN